jgi:hypothetical protein
VQSLKSNLRWRRSWPVGVVLLIVVLGAIWLVWPDGAPSLEATRISPEKSSVEKADTEVDGDARNASWISFERILLLAVVVANYLLLAVVGWNYWRASRRLDLGSVLSQQFQALGERLNAIERALRAGPSKPTTLPAPAPPDSSPKARGYEAPTEQPAPRRPPEQARRAPVFPSPPARTGPVNESRRSQESHAWNLVNGYCQVRGSSIVDLGQNAEALGLLIGSPSSTRGQRHVLNGPDPDPRLLAIKDGREEKLFVVVGAEATVAESEWLDLFEMRGFPGYCTVRSKRPATVNAVSGEVEEKGELEVLGST